MLQNRNIATTKSSHRPSRR